MQLYCGSWNVRLLTIRIFHYVVNLFIGFFCIRLAASLWLVVPMQCLYTHTHIHPKYNHDLWSTFDTIFNIFRVSLCHPRAFFLTSSTKQIIAIQFYTITLWWLRLQNHHHHFSFFSRFSTMFVTVFWVDSIMLQRLLLFRFDMHNFFTQFSIC